MKKKQNFLLVDGYNIIYAWNKLRKIADTSMEDARDKLIEILSNYAGVKNEEIIIVFDAHKVPGGLGSIHKENNVSVVYTKEAETADTYIEKTTRKIGKIHIVRVATSDALEQIIIVGQGAYRISAREFEREVNSVQKDIKNKIEEYKPIKNNDLMSNVDPKTAELLEKMRRGEFNGK